MYGLNILWCLIIILICLHRAAGVRGQLHVQLAAAAGGRGRRGGGARALPQARGPGARVQGGPGNPS